MNSRYLRQLSAWEIPNHHRHIFARKAHDYVLVVPVINEGNRIREQLKRIKKQSPAVDVVIADGLSTDGSLAHPFLKRIDVRALLIKTGPGKLSAQLRIAYAWCLLEGYHGIVTVDGNGKDGIEAIPNFLEALREGFDYVQGSRYIQGGDAINTPWDRKLAGRLIHAPLISMAGRYWLTDTTNGFRGYSRTFLLDPRVQPFRSVFDRYQLLFYLSVRACRLRFRVREIPVTRTYPKDGDVPSKIVGLKSRIAMIGELLIVVLGIYSP